MIIRYLIIIGLSISISTSFGQNSNAESPADLLNIAYKLFNDSQNYEEARIYIERAMDLMPTCSKGICDVSSCDKILCSKAWYLRAMTYAEPRYNFWRTPEGPTQTEYLESLECCNKALLINPSFPEALSQKGWNLIAMGKLDEAHKCLDQALAINQSYDEALELNSYLYCVEGEYKEGIFWANKAIESNPSWNDAYYWKYMNLKELRLLNEAGEAYNESLKKRDRIYKVKF